MEKYAWINTRYAIISKRLRELRAESGLSQSAIAGKIGINKASVVNYESGSRLPQTNTLVLFSELYDCSSDYILGLSDCKNDRA